MGKKWIYKTEKVGTNNLTLKSDLNKLGQDGWELVLLLHKYNRKWVAVLKKEK